MLRGARAVVEGTPGPRTARGRRGMGGRHARRDRLRVHRRGGRTASAGPARAGVHGRLGRARSAAAGVPRIAAHVGDRGAVERRADHARLGTARPLEGVDHLGRLRPRDPVAGRRRRPRDRGRDLRRGDRLVSAGLAPVSRPARRRRPAGRRCPGQRRFGVPAPCDEVLHHAHAPTLVGARGDASVTPARASRPAPGAGSPAPPSSGPCRSRGRCRRSR
jgi:hypothetical protein